MSYFIKFNHLSFSYESQSEVLFEDLNLSLYEGAWYGLMGPNGAGKTTFLKLLTGKLKPLSGSLEGVFGESLYCSQRTDEPPDLFTEFFSSYEGRALRLREEFELEESWALHEGRWHTLSHGERKRCQIACALWQEPILLAVDEPSNHLDGKAQEMIKKAFLKFKGIGIIVSHDRDLLDSLCSYSLFIEAPRVRLSRGNYSEFKEILNNEKEFLESEKNNLKKEFHRLDQEMKKRRGEADRSDSRVSKRHIDKKDSDARGRIDLARVTGKDAVGGKLLRQMESRFKRLEHDKDSLIIKKEYELGIEMRGLTLKKDFLFRSLPFRLNLGEDKTLSCPSLLIRPQDKIALSGPNGSGKTSLIRHILSFGGDFFSPDKILYIPQEILLEESKTMWKEIKNMNREELGFIMTFVSCLGSNPKQLLESEAPSPGEMRKLILAKGMLKKPYWLILDEPTNHLDLNSIECLEKALKQIHAGIFFVSHDKNFIKNLALNHWLISSDRVKDKHYDLECL